MDLRETADRPLNDGGGACAGRANERVQRCETARERWRWLMRRDLPNEEWRSAFHAKIKWPAYAGHSCIDYYLSQASRGEILKRRGNDHGSVFRDYIEQVAVNGFA